MENWQLLLLPSLLTTLLKLYLQQFLLPRTSCSGINKKFQDIPKGKKPPQSEETEQASELDVARILDLTDWDFRTTVIKVLRALRDKVDSMREQTGNVSTETNSQNKRRKPRHLKTPPETKNAFDGLSRRLDIG